MPEAGLESQPSLMATWLNRPLLRRMRRAAYEAMPAFCPSCRKKPRVIRPLSFTSPCGFSDITCFATCDIQAGSASYLLGWISDLVYALR